MVGRQGILLAAASVFAERGYSATTLRNIADHAGIKAGSVYHHFSSKDELFATVLDHGMTAMDEAFDRGDGSLCGQVRAHLGALFEHGPYTTAHVTAFFTTPADVREASVPHRDSYEAKWQRLLAGLLPRLDDDQVQLHRLLLLGAMNSTVEWFDPTGDVTLDQLAHLVTEQFLHGVTTSPTQSV